MMYFMFIVLILIFATIWCIYQYWIKRVSRGALGINNGPINEQISAVASTSNSSSVVSSKKYDVFLSFRGEDTRRSFTSHLYDYLMQKNVQTFIDNEELEKGDEISPALIKAIEDSHVSIIIFSKKYATSKWCLNELSKIMENCKKDKEQVVIPVFYNIDPSHVRKQTGSFEKAFKKHKEDKKCSKDEVQKWKAALTEAANLSGFHSETYRTDPELIKGIVTDVLQKLKLDYPTKLENLVGIDRKCAEVESLLKIGSREVRMIGIWGMAGIGKTTLATALYVKLCSQFDGCCLLASVRERSAKYGIDVLRNELFSKLLREENLLLDPKVEPKFVIRGLSRGKFLIVLDDVASLDQLEELIKDYKRFGAGSRVIVTTRDQHIIKQVEGSEIYRVMELNIENSLELFCLKAFGEKHPKHGYADLLKRAINYCKGNPLVLRVLAANLRSKDIEVWESKLEKLQMIQDVKILGVLKLSYDDLDHNARNIFLDIACFFKGWKRDKIINILKACGFAAAYEIDVLSDKALISVSCNYIEMHDLIQELGWEIVDQESKKDPGKQSRLWRHEEVCHVLKQNKGTNAIEGITLDLSKLNGVLNLRSDSFSSMTQMRFLGICGHKNKFNVCLPTGLDSLSDRLSYLCWDRFCLESLPSNFCAENLVELIMQDSKLKKLWDGVQNMVNLKRFDLACSQDLIKIPDLSKATNLEVVSLRGCKSLCELHPSNLSLPKLKHLYLEGCEVIKSLSVFCPSLEILFLEGCSSLEEFSVTSEKMRISHLNFSPICELPSSIWRNKKRRLLSLWGCNNVAQGFPHNIGHLSFLETLDLRETNVESLANVRYLPMLRRLRLDDCRRLRSLPELPPSLEMLSASNCTSIETDFAQQLVLQHMEFSVTSEEMRALHLNFAPTCEWPSSIWRNKKLRFLSLRGCNNVAQGFPCNIGHFPFLETLDLSETNVESLPANVKYLPMLTMLLLDECRRLRSLPELPPTLEILSASNCTSLETDFAQQVVLQHMEFSVTSEEMKALHLNFAPTCEWPSSIWRNKNLRFLSLRGCNNVAQGFPCNIGDLSFLETLDLSETNVESLPANIKYLPMLKVLFLDECRRLRSLPELPPSLEMLSASNCTSLETDFTQQLVLQHMLRSYIPSLRDDGNAYVRWNWNQNPYFLCPGDSVTDESWFRTGERSLTIPSIRISNLCGFIFCITLSKGLSWGYEFCRYSICEDGAEDTEFLLDPLFDKLALDHTLFCYINVSLLHKFRGYKKGIFRRLSFYSKADYSGIKGCGVFPVYASALGSEDDSEQKVGGLNKK